MPRTAAVSHVSNIPKIVRTICWGLFWGLLREPPYSNYRDLQTCLVVEGRVGSFSSFTVASKGLEHGHGMNSVICSSFWAFMLEDAHVPTFCSILRATRDKTTDCESVLNRNTCRFADVIYLAMMNATAPQLWNQFR